MKPWPMPHLGSAQATWIITPQGNSSLSQNTYRVKNNSTISHKHITQRAKGPVKEVLLHHFGLEHSILIASCWQQSQKGDNLIMHVLDSDQLKIEKAALLIGQLIGTKDNFF